MIPQEKLKEIKEEYGDNSMPINVENIDWLIARVEQLEEALSHIKENCACVTPEDCYDKAKEALSIGPS